MHWNRFDQLLSQYECSSTFDGVRDPFPGSHIALGDRKGSHLLSILCSGPVEICCHFFIAEQLELDISPKEVTSQLAHEEVLSFVENLADALEPCADIAPKNAEQMPFRRICRRAKCGAHMIICSSCQRPVWVETGRPSGSTVAPWRTIFPESS